MGPHGAPTEMRFLLTIASPYFFFVTYVISALQLVHDTFLHKLRICCT